jgi:hypothetical protein
MRALSLIVVMTMSAHAADISGTLQLAGRAPSIPMVSADVDLDVCGSEAKPLQSLVLGTNQAVRDAVVYLGAASANRSDAAAVLAMHDCEFVPRVQIVRSGATLVLRNCDSVLHVVRLESLSGTNGPATLLNVAAPYAGYERKFKLANFMEPTLLKASCGNGHGWMVAYLAVMPHFWAVMTDECGRFTLSGVPPGSYKLYAWHEVLGTLVREIKVYGGRATNVDLEFTSTVRK